MKTKLMKSISLFLVALFCLGVVGLNASTAHAQDEQEESGPIRIAVLDVPGGGSELIVAAVSQIENVDVQGQAWFLEQIQGRAFKAKGIMSRPGDLKWLMDGAEIKYILYLAAGEDETAPYTARLVGDESGEMVHEFRVERAAETGLTESSAKVAALEVAKYIDSQKPRDLEAEAAARAAEEKKKAELAAADDPNRLKRQVAADKQSAMDAYSRDWFRASVRGVGVRRDFNVTGSNKAVSAYSSAFYPGFSINLDAFPIGMSNREYAGIGFYADFLMGFDSVQIAYTMTDEEDNVLDVIEEISITHVDFEGGILYRLGDPLKLRSSEAAKVDLSLGVRHSNFAAAANIQLPSINHTSFVIGSRVTSRMFSDMFRLRAGVNISPIGIFGTGLELFGETAYTYGVGGALGAEISATDDIGIVFGYDFNLQRTNFTGQGELGFTDATAFELVQVLNAGISYNY